MNFWSNVEETSASVLCSRYLYRACQGTLFPNPVQVGRQLDKLPANTRRNILSLSRVRTGSPLSPEPPFLSLSKLSPKSCVNKDQKSTSGSKAPQARQAPAVQTNEERGQRISPTHTEKDLTDLCSAAPSELNSLPYTKNDPPLSRESPPHPSTKESETFKLSDQRFLSRITSTPLVSKADSIQLNLPPDGASQYVKYSRSSEEGRGSDRAAAHWTEGGIEQSLHTAL